MLAKLKKFLGSAFALLVVGVVVIIIFVGAKPLFIAPGFWVPPVTTEGFEHQFSDGRSLQLIFLPQGQKKYEGLAIVHHADTRGDVWEEASLLSVKGRWGLKALGRLWHVEGHPRLRLLPAYWVIESGFEPASLSMIVQSSFSDGLENPSPTTEEGLTLRKLVLFGENQIVFENEALSRRTIDEAEVSRLLRRLAPN